MAGNRLGAAPSGTGHRLALSGKARKSCPGTERRQKGSKRFLGKLGGMHRAQGFVAPGYNNVLDLFESLLREDPHYSAQLSAYKDGVRVVDLTGGPDMAPDTLTGAYSCSKGVAAMVIALLLQDGLLDLDQTVAHYWPEFGEHGKDRLLVRQALSHQAGLMGIEGGFGLDEFTTPAAAARLARAAPTWQPGRQFGYHALTIGIIMEAVSYTHLTLPTICSV